jgi:hypothetical protein
MSIKLNGATSGSVELDVPDAIGSDVSLTIPGAAGTLDRLERAGNILQVVQNHVTATSSVAVTAGSTFDIAVSASITPTYSSSKVLVRVRWCGEFNNISNHDMVFRLKRDGTLIGNPPSAGSRTTGISPIAQGFWDFDADSTPDSTWFEYLDSPNTTASVTYQMAGLTNSYSGTFFTNRAVTDSDSSGFERLTSGITLIEVAG